MAVQLFKDLPSNLRIGKVCLFCRWDVDDEIAYGKLYVYNNVVAHYYCLLFSSGLEQKGRDTDGILGFLTVDINKELHRGTKLSCSACKKTGATVGCCNKKCMKTFHYPCGVQNNMLNQFFGAFNSYCIRHQPTQNVAMLGYNAKEAKQMNQKAICTICHDEVPAYTNFDVLWAPCCKKQSWFHRHCIQKLALSAGYFFKCPICSNNSMFCAEMKKYGIYIPEQDASWELEPNAYQELIERHTTCDALTCICPKGRKHDGDGTRWELLLCSSCGSKGIHIGCGRLHWSTVEWDCDDCNLDSKNRTIKCRTVTPSVALKRPRPTVEDSSSDSDIEIDVTSPDIPTSSSFRNSNETSSHSRNVARRGRGSWFRRNRNVRGHCNLDNLRFKVTDDDKIIVYVNRENGSPRSYTIPVDHPVLPPHHTNRIIK